MGYEQRLVPRAPDFKERVQRGFAQQKVMETLRAHILRVDPGEVEIEFPFHLDFTQQDGILHAGIITAVIDSACGYAAFSLMPPGTSILTVEYKVTFLRPAKGDLFRARGSVIKPGRTLTFCNGEAFAEGVKPFRASVSTSLVKLKECL